MVKATEGVVMKLELICEKSKGIAHLTPLLSVHGNWHGAEFGTTGKIFPDTVRDVMQEEDWQTVAGRIWNFLGQRGL
jgi:hypothetical protein